MPRSSAKLAQADIDAIAEFKVQTNAFDAQSGHTAGAVVNLLFAMAVAGPPVFDNRIGYWFGLLYLALPASVLTFSLYYPVVRKILTATKSDIKALIGNAEIVRQLKPQAFVDDTSPDALPKVVDRLLASPHYGERWGRHWLDLVRYAETNGHEYDNDKHEPWRYRDYVIRSFNTDKPFDRFIVEQIAGDVGYASGVTLRNLLKTKTGLGVRELRRHGQM